MIPSVVGPYNSAGVGRTGAVIVIDAMLERVRHERTVDVYGHVTVLRSQRNYMVQTEDQYVFVHDALADAILYGGTEVPARALYQHIQRLTCIEPGDTAAGIEHEFKVGRVYIYIRAEFSFFFCRFVDCRRVADDADRE